MNGYFKVEELTHYLLLCDRLRREYESLFPHQDRDIQLVHTSILVAKSETCGLGKLMIDKGLITPEEYTASVIDGLNTTVESIIHMKGDKSDFMGLFRD